MHFELVVVCVWVAQVDTRAARLRQRRFDIEDQRRTLCRFNCVLTEQCEHLRDVRAVILALFRKIVLQVVVPIRQTQSALGQMKRIHAAVLRIRRYTVVEKTVNAALMKIGDQFKEPLRRFDVLDALEISFNRFEGEFLQTIRIHRRSEEVTNLAARRVPGCGLIRSARLHDFPNRFPIPLL